MWPILVLSLINIDSLEQGRSQTFTTDKASVASAEGANC